RAAVPRFRSRRRPRDSSTPHSRVSRVPCKHGAAPVHPLDHGRSTPTGRRGRCGDLTYHLVMSLPHPDTRPAKLPTRVYEKNLERLQRELVKLQEWVREEDLRLCVLFEGRDAAGKGGTIKRIVERTNPRVVRVAALGTPTE